MSYEIDNPEIQELLLRLAEKLGGQMPPGWGFTLFLFEFSDVPGASLFYISSARRRDMVKTVRQWLARQEQ